MGGFRYLGEREGPQQEPLRDEIGQAFWGGIAATVGTRINNGAFAESFPEQCPEYPVSVATNAEALGQAFRAEHPNVAWPLNEAQVPRTLAALEAIEFFHLHVSQVAERGWHDYFRHHHLLRFDRVGGQHEFRDVVNRMFRRNQLAYEIAENGEVRRIIQGPLNVILPAGPFNTGDGDLDRLLRQARDRIYDPDLETRRDALEKLWDAWERSKTLLDPDKRRGVQELLRAAIAEEPIRTLVETEGRALTDVGNQFMIRHAEVDKVPVAESDYIDYLFHRMYSLVWLLLKRTGRL